MLVPIVKELNLYKLNTVSILLSILSVLSVVPVRLRATVSLIAVLPLGLLKLLLLLKEF